MGADQVEPWVCSASGLTATIAVSGLINEVEANQLVGQLNQILEDKTYWNRAAKAKADATFEQQIVSAFYDHLKPEKRDGWKIREGHAWRRNQVPSPHRS